MVIKRSASAVSVALLLALGCAGSRAADRNQAGKTALSRRDYRTAVRAFGEAVKLDPKTTKYRYNLALALARTGLHQQAVTELEAILRMDPTDMEARRTLGRVQARIEDDRVDDVANSLH